MSNISIGAPLVDGSLMPYISKGEPCSRFVQLVTGDDLRPPPRGITIEIWTATGKAVRIFVPDDDTSSATVQIDGDIL